MNAHRMPLSRVGWRHGVRFFGWVERNFVGRKKAGTPNLIHWSRGVEVGSLGR